MSDDRDLTRLELRSADVVAPRAQRLAELFPEAVSDGKLDLEALRAALGDVVDDGPERFGLGWPGKREAIRVAQTPSEGTLVPMPAASIDGETTRNVAIEGDNLEVLKLLQRSYHRTVKLIYIDPPYNTGKDFIYHDDFRDPLDEYLRYSRQVDEGGVRLRANAERSGRYHSAWLSMMWPRLHLARSLLRDDGVIVVSIDDTEAPRLRMLLDDVFGEENFVCQFVWNNEGNVDNQSKVKGVHEYLVCYARELDEVADPTVIDPNIEESSKLFNDRIENSITKNGPANPPSVVELPAGFPCSFECGSIEPRDDVWPHVLDPVRVEGSALAAPARFESGWSSRNLLDLFIRNELSPIFDARGQRTWFALTESGAIYQYKDRSADQGHVVSVVRNVGTTKQTSNVLARWGLRFSYPKPTLLIQYMIGVFTRPAEGDLVMDLFAGSGTTGHATLAQNAEDGGDRRFLLVQLPERVKGDGKAEDGAQPEQGPTISELMRTRVARAAEGLQQAGRALADGGFRAYRLDRSALLPRRAALEAALLADDERPERDDDALLAEVLLARGLELTAPVEWLDVAGASAASVAGGALVACFARELTAELFEALVALAPAQLIVLESGFGGNDEVKVNALQHLRTVNAHRDRATELLVV
jgi:adenine-specific DNA-methyltransferase